MNTGLYEALNDQGQSNRLQWISLCIDVCNNSLDFSFFVLLYPLFTDIYATFAFCAMANLQQNRTGISFLVRKLLSDNNNGHSLKVDHKK